VKSTFKSLRSGSLTISPPSHIFLEMYDVYYLHHNSLHKKCHINLKERCWKSPTDATCIVTESPKYVDLTFLTLPIYSDSFKGHRRWGKKSAMDPASLAAKTENHCIRVRWRLRISARNCSEEINGLRRNKLGHGSRRDSKPRMTVLAKTSNNFLDCTARNNSIKCVVVVQL
jgi:hypothetical protein